MNEDTRRFLNKNYGANIPAVRPLPKKPNFNEEKYVDYDTASEGWGVFGVKSGFCFGLYADEESAKARVST